MDKKSINSHLDHLHNEVPGNYYDHAIENNRFQRYWHMRRFLEVGKSLPSEKFKIILDIGCHGGTFTSILKKEYPKAKLYGIDISKEAIAYAKKKYRKIIFMVARAESLPFENNTIDFITCFEVMEHIDNPKRVLKQIKRVLKKDGQLLILVPAETLLFKIIWFIWSAIGPGRIWNHTHVQKFNNKKLDRLIEKGGFRILSRRAFLFGMLLLFHAQKNKYE